jgi:tRNA 5-methylaminomethyl-2-thiouridine biosynthesis bifunctional protein
MLTPAQITWTDEGYPYSTQFNDVYFSGNGMEETAYVFLDKNRLAERFASACHFTVGETGFGTGLNFLCTLVLWRRTAPPSAAFHYIAFEKHPLTHADQRQALARWPELSEDAALLLSCLPPLEESIHCFTLSPQITVTLYYGDIADYLPQCDEQIDAWFLDGFAPAKNPAMWQETVFSHIKRLSHPGTTCSSFTAVGDVRRGLHAAGFTMQKVPGFGRKREMLVGEMFPALVAGSHEQ